MPPNAPSPRRSPRRTIRLPCLLEGESVTVPGHTVDASSEGLYVLVDPDAAEQLAVEVGSPLSIRVLLREQSIAAPATVVWLRPGERDAAGSRMMGLGVRLLGQAAVERLSHFLEQFRPTVIVADGDAAERSLLANALASDHRVLTCESGAEALRWLEQREPSALVIGDTLSDMRGCVLAQRCAAASFRHHAALIFVHGHEDAAEVDALVEEGTVFYFLQKPLRVSELRQVVRRGVDAGEFALENDRLTEELERVNARLARENRFLRKQVAVWENFEGVVGQSPALREVFAQLQRVSATDSPVHLQGETGTGKELVARALHYSSARAQAPFLAVNCAGVPDTLLQSTLFGHRRGAFTGADRDHPGVFAEADGGTLFLDEVAELSPSTQAALLRALDQGEIQPVGASAPVRVNVRILSATHADLRTRVRSGQFREDLFFRLVVVSVRLPPLRERREDIAALAEHFLKLHQERMGRSGLQLGPDLLRALEQYAWPGNVRELEHEIERLVVLVDEGESLTPQRLSPQVLAGLSTPSEARALSSPTEARRIEAKGSFDETIDHFMRERIAEALRASDGNLTDAAKRLGLERSRLGKLRARLWPKAGAA